MDEFLAIKRHNSQSREKGREVTMSKSIKVDDRVYQDLENIRGKRETFSEAIARMINVARLTSQAGEILGEFPLVIRSTGHQAERG